MERILHVLLLVACRKYRRHQVVYGMLSFSVAQYLPSKIEFKIDIFYCKIYVESINCKLHKIFKLKCLNQNGLQPITSTLCLYLFLECLPLATGPMYWNSYHWYPAQTTRLQSMLRRYFDLSKSRLFGPNRLRFSKLSIYWLS